MKRKKKILITSIFLLLFMFFVNIESRASSDNKLFLNDLDFEVNVNSDGSMDVTEYWDIEVEDTNTLFKTFKTDSKKYSSITDVTVTDITIGQDRPFTEIHELMYHVTEGCYYGMTNDDGDFEIAWGIGYTQKSGTRKYEIKYKVNDAISKHADYAQLYWQFVGNKFDIDAKQVRGTIVLPDNVDNKDNIKVWGHTEDLNGEIYVIDTNKIEFNVDYFNSGRYIEIRTLFPTQMITSSAREDNNEILNSVIEEESILAKKANDKRARQRFWKICMIVITNIILILICIKFIKNMIKSIKELKELKKLTPTEEIIYYRDIPRENATPAESVYLYKQIKNKLESNDIGKIFSATLLDFSLKNIIEFKVDNEKSRKEKITIRLINKNSDEILKNEDEMVIFRFLVVAFGGKEEITIKELEKYIKNSSSEIISLQDKINRETELSLQKANLIDKEQQNEYDVILTSRIFYTSAALLVPIIGIISEYMLIGGIPFVILSVINLILLSAQLRKINVYTQEGIDESEKWKGLKKYMEEFSMLDKREVPEVVIWEKFMVYATAFGIADKVLKQLKIVYPDLENTININDYSYMYLMMNTDFSRSFTNAINTSMSAANSSATGGGGGFSAGGGGGGRRPVVEEVDNLLHQI